MEKKIVQDAVDDGRVIRAGGFSSVEGNSPNRVCRDFDVAIPNIYGTGLVQVERALTETVDAKTFVGRALSIKTPQILRVHLDSWEEPQRREQGAEKIHYEHLSHPEMVDLMYRSPKLTQSRTNLD